MSFYFVPTWENIVKVRYGLKPSASASIDVDLKTLNEFFYMLLWCHFHKKRLSLDNALKTMVLPLYNDFMNWMETLDVTMTHEKIYHVVSRFPIDFSLDLDWMVQCVGFLRDQLTLMFPTDFTVYDEWLVRFSEQNQKHLFEQGYLNGLYEPSTIEIVNFYSYIIHIHNLVKRLNENGATNKLPLPFDPSSTSTMTMTDTPTPTTIESTSTNPNSYTSPTVVVTDDEISAMKLLDYEYPSQVEQFFNDMKLMGF